MPARAALRQPHTPGGANRQFLRPHGIRATIAEPADYRPRCGRVGVLSEE
jgi:hypothetical protein